MTLSLSTDAHPNGKQQQRSAAAFGRARAVFPGGTTRATIPARPNPIYMASGQGAWLTDLDGNRYLDLNNNFTTLIHGHAFPPVIDALRAHLSLGTCFANPTAHEIALAELLCARIPSADRIRFVNTGTEAVMFAVKAARAYTGRPGIAKLVGAYHGAYDWAEVSESCDPAGWKNGVPPTLPVADGTPQSVLDEVVVLPINDVTTSLRLIEDNRDRLAAVLVDMMPSRAGLLPLAPEYVLALRDAAQQHGIVLISDEVLTFRLGMGGAAAAFGIRPDLMALGKIIGGGLPIGAVAGRADVMEVFDRLSARAGLPQGGTFSANPLSMVAGLASMRALDDRALAKINDLGDGVRDRLSHVAAGQEPGFSVTGGGSLFRIHPKNAPPSTYAEAFQAPQESEQIFQLYHLMAETGVLISPSGLGAISTAMTADDIDLLVSSFESSAARLS